MKTWRYVIYITLLQFSVFNSARSASMFLHGFSSEHKDKIVLQKNIGLSKQLTQPNTTYVIQYDFLLDGNVTIPYDCVLQFDGGSIKDNGTHTLIGQNTGITAGLEGIFNTDISLVGTWNIDKFDIRWFGVNSNDKSIDCTPIINNIKGCNVPIYFPKGTYYLSELYYQNTKNDSFSIIGEEPYGLSAKVNFMPFSPSQRYIIKIGGGANTLGGIGESYNIKIMHINFTTPYGYKPSKLTNSYTSTNNEYLNGGLILDEIEMGHFAVSGSGIHNMPFLVVGYIYECEFDYIICYGNHGKSVQPAIQIVNSQTKPYSALHVKKMMGEVLVGPMIKTVGRCAGSELVIDNFYFEGTIRWEKETINSEKRYDDIINLSDYVVVPMFDLEGCGFTIIDAELNMINSTWTNRLDAYSKPCIRGLFNFNNTLEDVSILRLGNNGGSRWMYITGSAIRTYPINVLIGRTNCRFQTDTRYINLIVEDKRIINGMGALSLKSNLLYSDGSLEDITIPYFINNNGTNSFIQQAKSGRKEVSVLPNSYIFNEYGFSIDPNMTCIYFEYLIDRQSNCDISIEYYNSSNKYIASQKSQVLADKSISQQVITINPPSTASFFKLKYGANSGNTISIFKFGIFDCDHVPVKKAGSKRPGNNLLTPGFEFFDTILNIPIYWTGNQAKGDNGWVDALGNYPQKK